MANKNDVIKKLGLTIPDKIVDDETGEKIPFDIAKVKLALDIIAEFRYDLKRIAKYIKTFFVDEKLYLYLGVTKTEAALRFFGMSENSLRRYEHISISYEEDEIDNIGFLGVGKLDVLSRLPEEFRKDIISGKSITLPDGTEISIEELKDIRVAELERKIKKLKLENSNLTVNFDEEKNFHKSEVISLKEQVKDLEALTDVPPQDQKFYKRITKLRDSQKKVFESESAFNAAFMCLYQIEINDSNREILSSIEGHIAGIAGRLLDLEAHFGISLGMRKESIQAVARK